MQGSVYQFESSAGFQGDNIYNPYQGSTTIQWVKANFHAHGEAWAGVTNGYHSEEEVENVYHEMGYGVCGVSNYHKRKDTTSVSVYEHGYNVPKSHRLVIGGEEVAFFDFPIFQSIHHKQTLLNHVAESDNFVVLAHPSLRGGYSHKEVQQLTGYQAVEVMSHYSQSESHWDAALSAGKPVWGMANDDAHDVHKHGEVGKYFNWMPENGEYENALHSGAYFFGTGYQQQTNPIASLVNDTLGVVHLTLNQVVDSVQWLTANLECVKSELNCETSTVLLDPEKPFLRAVVYTKEGKTFTNPIYRYQNAPFEGKEASAAILPFPTAVYRVFIVLIELALIFLWAPAYLIKVFAKWVKRTRIPASFIPEYPVYDL